MNTQRLPGEQEPPRGNDGSLQPGMTLQNRYRITGVLGVGGMGSVYLARDMNFTAVTRNVAVKEMLNLSSDAGMREITIRTFEREANILAELNHPAIPKIYDYFTSRDRAYLVMEYINGKDLEAIINTMPDFLPAEMIRKWALELCDVLDYLHSHQPEPIIFRDMKPSNVMVDSTGRIRLIDFGIAKTFQANQKGTMIGTEGYSPPEQYRGEASPQGDIYALGGTLHHLATRKDPRLEPPFSYHERPIRQINPKIPVELERIILRALEYQPGNRFQTAAAMRDSLNAIGQNNVVAQVAAPAAAPVAGAAGDAMRTVDFGGAGIAPQPQPLNTAAVSPAAPPAPTAPAAPPSNDSFEETSSIKALWKFKCEDEIRGMPLFNKNVVYVGAYDNNLYAVNSGDGSFRWKYATEGGISSSPAISNEDNMVVFGSEDNSVYALDIRTGKIIWSYQTKGPVRSSPTIAGGHAFIGSDDGKFYAIRLGTGRPSWQVDLAAPMRSKAAVTADKVVVPTESGAVLGLDLTGNVKWRFNQAKRAITSWPIVDNDIAYFGSMDNHVYALDIVNGWAVWRFRAGKAIVGSPLLVGKTLYVGCADSNLYALDISSGRELWRFQAGGQIVSSPAHLNGALYFGCVDKNVYSIEAKKGKLRWMFPTDGPIASSPTIVEKTMYIGSTDKYLYALST